MVPWHRQFHSNFIKNRKRMMLSYLFLILKLEHRYELLKLLAVSRLIEISNEFHNFKNGGILPIASCWALKPTTAGFLTRTMESFCSGIPSSYRSFSFKNPIFPLAQFKHYYNSNHAIIIYYFIRSVHLVIRKKLENEFKIDNLNRYLGKLKSVHN